MTATSPTALPYRLCAGIMMLNDAGNVFVGRRIDTTSDAWQMPQGGIDAGEDPKQAALRELKEEIGTNDVRIIAASDNWLDYDLPEHLIPKLWNGAYRGQRQKWFLCRFLGQDEAINIHTSHPEFNAWKWVNPQQLPDIIVPFKRALYQAVLESFKEQLWP